MFKLNSPSAIRIASTQITTIRAVDRAPVSVVARWRFSSCVMLAVPSSFFRNRFTMSRETRVTTNGAADDDDPDPVRANQSLKSFAAMEFMGPHATGRIAPSTMQTDEVRPPVRFLSDSAAPSSDRHGTEPIASRTRAVASSTSRSRISASSSSVMPSSGGIA